MNTPSPIYAALKKRLCLVGLSAFQDRSSVRARSSINEIQRTPSSERESGEHYPASEQKHLNSNVDIHRDLQPASYATDQSIPVSLNTNYLNNHGALPNDYLHSNHNNFSSFNSWTSTTESG